MIRQAKALEVLERQRARKQDTNNGLPQTLWSDAHARALATLIPNPALLPSIDRTGDGEAQDASGNFYTTPGWDD